MKLWPAKKLDSKAKDSSETAKVGTINRGALSTIASNKTLKIIAALLVIVGGAVLLGLWKHHHDYQVAHSPVNICSQEILKEAGGYLDISQTDKLKPVIDKIKNLKDYQKDPNCLNPIVTYYFYTNNYNDAQSNLDLLVARYDSKKGFSSDLGPKARSLDGLKADVAGLKQLKDKKYNGHVRTLEPPK